ncbi:EF-hand domain-containing protein [Pseudomonas sp. CM25]|uniref:EF-hand domain-containing protein n=1 Tax=unclassified Pseudomonas TaxID=196821 RepID=UPI00155413A8|nr:MULTISPECIES: EF-hand domain-containing protein [unclassified Pseudomonas]NQD55256.1 EF-hand domain-containing protein [Pseudomonas sp. CM25]NQD74985.1 EF-hand domain-containing protein [Pseudomonas sp. CM27]HEN8799858.1 EF-hand domain-containing protein [Pseudomonas putida]
MSIARSEQELKENFAKIDVNGDGKITVDEFRALLVSGIREDYSEAVSDVSISDIVDKYAKQQLASMDADGNNEVSFKEYKSAYDKAAAEAADEDE